MSPRDASTPAAAAPDPAHRWYEVDGQDVLVAVDPGWDEFARANAGSGAVAACVLGRRLDAFVTNDATLMFIDAVLQAARLTGRPRQVDYRCDAPGQMRRFQMRVTPLANGHVRIEHALAEQAPRPVQPGFRFNAQARRLRCSQCLSLREPGGTWLLPERQTELARRHAALDVAYTVCPPCTAAAERMLDTRAASEPGRAQAGAMSRQ